MGKIPFLCWWRSGIFQQICVLVLNNTCHVLNTILTLFLVGLYAGAKRWIKPYFSAEFSSLRRSWCEFNISLKPLFLSALFYSSAASSKHFSSHEIPYILLLIMAGICLVIDGGWFDCLWIYNNSFLTFLYGYSSIRKLKLRSEKSVIRKLYFTVIFNPCCLKILPNVFIIFLDSGREGFENNLVHHLYTNQSSNTFLKI